MLQMVSYPSRVAHAAGRYYHLRLRVGIEPYGFLTCPGEPEVLEVEWIVAFCYVFLRLIVENLGVPLENLCGRGSHRAVHVNHYILKGLTISIVGLIDSVELVYQLLSPSHRKGRYHRRASLCSRVPDDVHQRLDIH